MSVRLWAVALLALTAGIGLAAAEEKPKPRLDLYGDPLPEGAVARLGTVRWRTSLALCPTFSPDGKVLFAGRSLWDAASGKELVRLEGVPLRHVQQQAAFSPDGATLATLDNTNVVRLWDARTGKYLRRAEREVKWREWSPFSFTFAPDGRTLYAGLPRVVRAITVADGKAAALPSPPERGLSLDLVSPDGAAAVSAAKDGRLVVWDLKSGKTLAEVDGPEDPGLFALAPGNRRLAVESRDDAPAILVYDLASGKEVSRCKGYPGEMGSLVFARDGKTLVGSVCDRKVWLCDVETGRERWSAEGEGLAFAADGKTVAVTRGQAIVRLFDAATGKERAPLAGHLDFVHCLAVTPDGRAVFTASFDQSLRLWDLHTGKEIRRLKEPNVLEDELILYLALKGNGKELAVGERKGVRLWDLSDPRRPRAGERLDDQYWCAFAPDGKTLATVDHHLRLLDLGTRKVLREAEVNDGKAVCFSPDGRTLAVGYAEGVVRLWDVRTWAERAVIRGHDRDSTAWMVISPDGQLLATTDGRGQELAEGRPPPSHVVLSEVASGKLRRRIEWKENGVDAFAFSPDGRLLAIAGKERADSSAAIALYEVASGRIVHTFRGHDQYVACLAFTPDGRRLISGSHDTTALVWDLTALPAPATREVKRTEKELTALWARLTGDAEKADEAMRALAASPAQAAELLGRSLKPADRETADRIARLICDLDSDSFAQREQVSAALEKLGDEAAEALRDALADPSAEVRQRAEALLKKLNHGPSSERLRRLRSVEVLEWIGTPEARRVLDRLAGGDPRAELTRAAQAARARFARRS
jgi:WD40 repeat protein